MAIDVINIRAVVDFEDTNFSVSTPYIQSFNVTKTRNTVSTFTLAVKVESTRLNDVAGELSIYAGVRGKTKKIFTGFVKKVVPSPVLDDPKYVMLNITGTDILYRLENKKVTRRELDSDTSWAMITGVRSGNKSSLLKFAPNEESMIVSDEIQSGTMPKEGATITKEEQLNLGRDTKQPAKQPTNMQVTIGYSATNQGAAVE